MKIVLFVAIFFSAVGLCSQQTSLDSISVNQKRVVFIGNSITYSGIYIKQIETYLLLHDPDFATEIINVGLPSETVSQLSEPNHAGGRFSRPALQERLDRVLAALHPDVVFACYGMNDGIYLPFDEERFLKYKQGIEYVERKVNDISADIVFLTPPVYDGNSNTEYAGVLDRYSDWLLEEGERGRFKVVDIHNPMKKALEKHRKQDSTFVLAKDGIHPQEYGHWLMAKEVLLFLNQKVGDIDSFGAVTASVENGKDVFSLITKRQNIMRDAWLNFIGHERPTYDMTAPLPLEEAKQKALQLNKEISSLTRK